MIITGTSVKAGNSIVLLVLIFIVSVAATLGSSSNIESIRRKRRRVDASDYRDCPQNIGPAFWIYIAPDNPMQKAPIVIDPTNSLILSRSFRDFTDEEVAAFFEEAYGTFLEVFGIDFSNSVIDPESGFRVTTDGSMMMVSGNSFTNEYHVQGTSFHGGVSDCPLTYHNEFIAVLAQGDGMYYGTFGGQEGRAMKAGDTISVGTHFFDLDQDGVYDPIRYHQVTPLRTASFGERQTDVVVQSDVYGTGRQFGYFNIDFATGVQHFYGATLHFTG